MRVRDTRWRASGSSSRYSAPGASVWPTDTSSVVRSSPLGVNSLRPSTRKRVVFCAGKVYYDLIAKRSEVGSQRDVAVIRIEQLYPWPADELNAVLQRYRSAREWVWVQEESQNMGAWSFMEPRLWALFGRKIIYAGRNASASPAVGSLAIHKREQAQLIADAFSL